MKVIKNFGRVPCEAVYKINGVKYIVSSRFSNPENILKFENTFEDRIKSYIGSDFADLITDENDAIIYPSEYDCRKED